MTRSISRTTIVLAVIAGVLLTGCGNDDDSAGNAGQASDTRTVEVEMHDTVFSPERVEVEAGETVRFVFRNEGKVVHDAFIGDEGAQDEHEMEMREADEDTNGGGHDGGHDDAGDTEGGITVEPSETGELTHTFREAGTLLIGCHQPGHYDAGMRMTIDVS